MSELLRILISALRARIMKLWIKVRLWTSPSFLKSTVLVKIREFFVGLLDVRPRHKQDYYGIFRWLVSKRLAFALVVALAIISGMYIAAMLPAKSVFGKGESIPTYKYRSIPLKFYSGRVNILARDGYVAYTGQVEKGSVTGEGTLYNREGAAVYEGQFSDNMYNGAGTLFYPSGSPQYSGEFTNNVFHGVGSYYRLNGAKEYVGDYVSGVRSGSGVLYNTVGDKVYEGSFLNDAIVYHDFLTRPVDEVSKLYSGEAVVYQSEDEYCVTMPEIRAVYSVKDGSNTLENEWTVDRVFILEDSVVLEKGVCSTLRQLKNEMGKPLYFGTAWVNLPEAVSWNLVAQEQPELAQPITISAQQDFEDAFTVDGYDRNREMYLYSFEYNGILYSFYFAGSGESEFLMYSIEKA